MEKHIHISNFFYCTFLNLSPTENSFSDALCSMGVVTCVLCHLSGDMTPVGWWHPTHQVASFPSSCVVTSSLFQH